MPRHFIAVTMLNGSQTDVKTPRLRRARSEAGPLELRPKIIVLDEDRAVRRIIQRELGAAGFRVEALAPNSQTVAALFDTEFALALLDIDAESIDGVGAVRRFRASSSAPLIALSAKPGEDAAVEALESGADDFVLKPFGARALIARVKNALRRRLRELNTPENFVSGDLEVDFVFRRVRFRGQQVHLGPKPYELLRVLAENAGKVLTHRQLLRAIWGEKCLDRIGYLRLAVHELRQKLEIDAAHPSHILTEARVGYRLQ